MHFFQTDIEAKSFNVLRIYTQSHFKKKSLQILSVKAVSVV